MLNDVKTDGVPPDSRVRRAMIAPRSPNGNMPSPREKAAPDPGLVARVLSWVDMAATHLISDRRRRALIKRSREIDDRLERVARKLTRREHKRGTE